MSDNLNKLEILREQVAACVKCDLHKTRKQTVFARGNPQSYLVFVGEAPGAEEDESGLPFIGRSGQLLDQTLTEIGLNLNDDIYVCNIIKCHPPGNRRPTDFEVNICIDYIEEQLKLVNPKIIIALGNTAISGLLPFDGGITKIHGKFFKRGKFLVCPVYHPSYVLRNGGIGSKVYQEFKNDLQTAIVRVQKIIAEQTSST